MSARGRGDAWSPEHIDQLRRLVADRELSASEIAEVIGGTTRNAVIGKVHRMGLRLEASRSAQPARRSHHKQTASMPGPKRKRVYASNIVHSLASRAKAPVALPAASPAPLECLRLPLESLTNTMCRWPLGHPGEAGFGFCALPMAPGRAWYCADHARLAYTPAIARVR